MKDVAGIVVNYQTKELTAEAVKSVLDQPEVKEVVIVDNNSQDGSLAYLQEIFKDMPVKIIASGKNVGFGGANNLGISQVDAQYVVILNSDAFCMPGCIGLLKKRLATDASLGIVAPAVYQSESHTLQADAYGRFPTLRALLFRTVHNPVDDLQPDWVSGVAFMMRRQEFIQLGGFDSRLFMYFEDIDLCRRYLIKGLKVARELQTEVVHLGGASNNSKRKQKKDYYQSQDTYLQLAKRPLIERLLVKVLRLLARS